jgi:hypothetical protein
MALFFMVFIGTVACSNSPSSDLSTTGTEVSGSTSPEGKAPSSTPPDSSAITPDSPPPLPPPVSVEADLEAAHKSYAEYTKASLLGIQMCWKDSGHESQLEYSKGVLFFNDFLRFVYCSDSDVRSRIDYTKILVKNAHDSLGGKDWAGFSKCF